MAHRIRCGIVDPESQVGSVFVVHGGAGPQDPKTDRAERAQAAIRETADSVAKDASWIRSHLHLKAALSTAESIALAAVHRLEDHPLFNAGHGAALQADGQPRVSAAYMESERRKFSAIMNAEEVGHPSLLAHYLQQERFSILDGRGAQSLCRDLGIAREELVTVERFERWVAFRKQHLERGARGELGSGTVGCVATDAEGRLAAVTSTGGVGHETPGRVGDTPTIAGNYCSSRVALSCTGIGEHIIGEALAARVAVRVEDGMALESAIDRSLSEGVTAGHEVAIIGVARDADGRIHWAAGTTTSSFIWAAVVPGALLEPFSRRQ